MKPEGHAATIGEVIFSKSLERSLSLLTCKDQGEEGGTTFLKYEVNIAIISTMWFSSILAQLLNFPIDGDIFLNDNNLI